MIPPAADPSGAGTGPPPPKVKELRNKLAGLSTTLHIILDKASVEGDALALGACIQSLTSEGWHLRCVLEGEDGSLEAVLYRTWEVGHLPLAPERRQASQADGEARAREPRTMD